MPKAVNFRPDADAVLQAIRRTLGAGDMQNARNFGGVLAKMLGRYLHGGGWGRAFRKCLREPDDAKFSAEFAKFLPFFESIAHGLPSEKTTPKWRAVQLLKEELLKEGKTLTDKEIAQKIGVARTTLYKWPEYKAMRAAMYAGRVQTDPEKAPPHRKRDIIARERRRSRQEPN